MTKGIVICDWRALALEPNDTIRLGHRRSGWGEKQSFGLSVPDSRQHLVVIGKTGAGKTTLLFNLLVQHIEAGRGVMLIDPHGDFSERLLDYIPPWRFDHVTYFNPSDVEHPIGLNPLADIDLLKRHLVVAGVVSCFKSLWPDAWGPRLEYLLTNAVASLSYCQNVTLLGIPRLFTEARYRRWVIRQVKDPLLRHFWIEEFERYDDRFLREAIAPVQNKVNQFVMTPLLRNILGQVKNKVSPRFIMDNGRIFIANLSRGKLGETPANLLGSLLVTQFQLAAMGRADVPEDKRRDFTLVVDEFHAFTTDSFTTILSEARKYRLCLVLAHQFTEQLSPELRAAIFGNVGTIIVFRVGSRDAEILEREFMGEFSAAQLVDLPRYHAGVRLLEDGENRAPFMAEMLPPLGHCYGRKEKLIRHSRERFAAPRAVVEDKIQRWLGQV